jgi:hypothetical protein
MDIQKKKLTFLLKIILKLPLIANLHKQLTLKSPEMRFVFKIILNLQKIQNKQILILNNFTIRQNYYF